jgi:hypothetical protein
MNLAIFACTPNIGGDVQWFDVGQIVKMGVVIAPSEKPVHGPVIGRTGVLIPDRGREEF